MDKKNIIKALIIDDELGACKNLHSLIDNYTKDIEVIGYAQNTVEAEKLMHEHSPDVLFLDIEMPGERGIEFIQRIQPIEAEIIFVTAYNEFALKAFKLNALDYILKPIGIEYLVNCAERLNALVRAKKAVQNKSADPRISSYVNSEHNSHILLRDSNDIVQINFKDIIYLEAKGSYCKFNFKRNSQLSSITSSYNLLHYEEILPTDIFLRIHKSYLMNVRKIRAIRTKENASYCVLDDETLIPISRRRLKSVKDFLKGA